MQYENVDIYFKSYQASMSGKADYVSVNYILFSNLTPVVNNLSKRLLMQGNITGECVLRGVKFPAYSIEDTGILSEGPVSIDISRNGVTLHTQDGLFIEEYSKSPDAVSDEMGKKIFIPEIKYIINTSK